MPISVVMLTWNNFEKFQRCSQSMFHMMLDDRVEEILILDNGSHEITLLNLLRKLNKQCKKFRVIFNPENLGVAGGRDLLFKEAKGDHIFSVDSDVTILNHDALINIYLDFVSHDDHWLLGGGGGNHPFFPSIDLRDVVNLPSQKEANKLTFIDEVAGWFTAFPSKILKQNGGPIYMDTQFNPFWGEDSDFCYQIKELNKKCAIVGAGLIAHKWSSCDKEENKSDMYPMWKKLMGKWYGMKKYKDKFKFDFDDHFYEDNYGVENKDPNRKLKLRDIYLNKGMYKGEVGHKRIITDLYPDANFLSNTELEWNGEKYSTTTFVDDYINYEKITEQHYKVLEDTLNRDCNGVYFYTTHEENEDKTLQVLGRMKKTNIVFNCHCQNVYSKSIDYIKKNFKSYHISTFYNYQNDDLVFMILLKKFNDYNFKSFAKLNPRIKLDSTLFDYDLDNLHKKVIEEQGIIDSEDIEKEEVNRHNYLGLQRLLTPSQSFIFSKEGLFINYFQKYKFYANTNQFNIALENAIRIPFDFHNIVNPRISTRHCLRKYISFVSNMPYEIKTLIIYACNIDNMEDYELVKNNCKILRESGKYNKEIMLLNGGEIKNFKLSDLKIDYCYISERFVDKKLIIPGISRFIPEYENYTNIVFFFKDKKLVTNVDDFMDNSIHLNYSIALENMKIDIEFFSIINSFYPMIIDFISTIFAELKKTQKINIEDTVKSNLISSFRMTYLWDITKETADDEESYQFYKIKERMDDEEDYPFEF